MKGFCHMKYCLQGNSWLWDVEGLNILVDPILVGNLDFGLPWLFEGAKKVLGNFRVSNKLFFVTLPDSINILSLENLLAKYNLSGMDGGEAAGRPSQSRLLANHAEP